MCGGRGEGEGDRGDVCVCGGEGGRGDGVCVCGGGRREEKQ